MAVLRLRNDASFARGVGLVPAAGCQARRAPRVVAQGSPAWDASSRLRGRRAFWVSPPSP
eukprot:4676127-Prymnesium_polylepis.2